MVNLQNTDCFDRQLEPLLKTGGLLNAYNIYALRRWWLEESYPEEQPVSFLTREQVFHSGAEQLIELCQRGLLQLSSPEALLSARGLEVIQQRCAHPFHNQSQGVTVNSGDRVGRYVLGDALGYGRHAVVFQASHVDLDNDCVIKLPRLDDNKRRQNAERQLLREARLLASLSHSQVVTLKGFDRHRGIPYMVLEGPGVSLRDLIRKQGRLEPLAVIRLARHIASALAHCHARGILHRDVKPANIMVMDDGTCKLADFGVARVLEGGPELPPSLSIESPGQIIGTPKYIAPEQIHGCDDLDFRADIYGLGTTLYHALVGRAPYESNDALDILEMHIKGDAVAPKARRGDVPQALSDLILRMMARLREQRFDSDEDLLHGIDEVRGLFNSASGRSAQQLTLSTSQRVALSKDQVRSARASQVLDLGSQREFLDVLQVLSLGGQTGVLSIEHGAQRGELFFREGEIIDGRLGLMIGNEAFAAVGQMAKQPGSRFQFREVEIVRETRILEPTMGLIFNMSNKPALS